MRIICLSLIAAIAMLVSVPKALASDSDYMTFQCTDGAVHAISSDNLTISIADNLLIASNGSETLTLDADKVTRFFFGNTAGIVAAIFDNSDQPVTVISLSGVVIGNYSSIDECLSQLPKGIHIIKSGNKSIKLQVK